MRTGSAATFTSNVDAMAIRRPFNLLQRIEDNRRIILKPPVGNKNLYTESGDYIVMIVKAECA